ncbi:MAG: hypothetical protein ACI4RF_07875, partial [Eubacterium sp.]
MNEEKDDISKILEEFKVQKEKREQVPIAPLEPPKRREDYIDFAKTANDNDGEITENEPAKPKKKKEPKPQKTPEEFEAIKTEKQKKRQERKEKSTADFIKVKNAVFNKKTLAVIIAVAAVIAIIFGIKAAVEQSKIAYLKPYESKYPDVEFQVGMLEKYCDMLGENPDTVGYIEIPDIDLKSPVSSDTQSFPYAQSCTEGASQFNYVVYLNDNSLEKIYSTAEAYNNSSGYITYSDLFNDYSFKIVGAFYTNTAAEDDNGYIFPYNVTEKMTTESANEYVSRLESRFIYSTAANITRQDTLLTISCPTDYRKDFRFVVIGVMRENADDKSAATEKSNVHYPQV